MIYYALYLLCLYLNRYELSKNKIKDYVIKIQVNWLVVEVFTFLLHVSEITTLNPIKLEVEWNYYWLKINYNKIKDTGKKHFILQDSIKNRQLFWGIQSCLYSSRKDKKILQMKLPGVISLNVNHWRSYTDKNLSIS